jgi:hypothetical protein
MAYTIIDDPSAYFNILLYTGNGASSRDLTFSANAGNFQADWLWFKQRSQGSRNNNVYDSVRGNSERLETDNTGAEETQTGLHKTFNTNGFTIGAGNIVNENNQTFVTWGWKAGGSASSNTDGSITSTVSANTTAGFSIVKYTGTESAGATVGHGLGVAPDVIIVKNYAVTKEWNVYHSANTSTPQNDYLILNETNATNSNSGRWNNTAPSSSIFTLGEGSETNGNGNTHIAYCFAEKKGFSKFGSYTGNSSSDGPFVYTGFKPAYVVQKATSGSGSWAIYDNGRNPFNGAGKRLFADNADTESDGEVTDLLSNGFKIRNTGSGQNQSGVTYIYMAFAENPLVTSTGIPTTAR